MDLQEVLKRSRKFYREHQLADWREALPKSVAELDRAIAADAERAGFGRAFAFPPFAVQMAEFDRLVEATARQPAPGLPDNHQYREPFLADSWTKTPNGKILQRPDNLGVRTEGPYLLLFSTSPLKNAWGRTGKQITELFDAKGWHGLTVPEYLVLQRFYCERFGDHRFFDEPQDETTSHWLWLVDSANDSDMAVSFGSARGINIQACPIGNRESRRAALAAAMLPV